MYWISNQLLTVSGLLPPGSRKISELQICIFLRQYSFQIPYYLSPPPFLYIDHGLFFGIHPWSKALAISSPSCLSDLICLLLSISFVMVRAFSNEHSDAFPFEGEALPHTSAFVQNTPRSTLPYLEQNPPFPSSVYDPYMQPPWAFVGFGLSIPATSPQIGMDSITGWVGDNASPAGAENTINSSCIGSERSDPNCHQQGQFSAPIGDQLKEAAYEASPPDNRTSRRRRSKLNAK